MLSQIKNSAQSQINFRNFFPENFVILTIQRSTCSISQCDVQSFVQMGPSRHKIYFENIFLGNDWPIIGSLIESRNRFLDFVQWTKETGYNIVLRKLNLDIKQNIVGRNLRHITELCISARPCFLMMIGDDGIDGNADIVKNQLVTLA